MKLLPSDPDIQTIVARINNGDLDLQPNFQRGEVWATSKKRKLIDSILRDWHVPPIHVVVSDDGKQEVLDGQQRLVSIRDFVNGDFRIDGHSEPFDKRIFRLNGLHYFELPTDVKRAFDQFTIRIFRLTDYLPGEPGELFFRLNQMTHLTAAEQRNAYYGPVREQVRDLVLRLERMDAYSRIGFSNRRMAYDDVLAKLLCTYENNSLNVKLGSSEISQRYRADQPFARDVVELATQSLDFLLFSLAKLPVRLRFNKATLFSWLVFSARFIKRLGDSPPISDFIYQFEEQRARSDQSLIEFKRAQISRLPHSAERALFRIFTDRSSSRVLDVSSIVYRDVILWIFYFDVVRDGIRNVLPSDKADALLKMCINISERERESVEAILEELTSMYHWGDLT